MSTRRNPVELWYESDNQVRALQAQLAQTVLTSEESNKLQQRLDATLLRRDKRYKKVLKLPPWDRESCELEYGKRLYEEILKPFMPPTAFEKRRAHHYLWVLATWETKYVRRHSHLIYRPHAPSFVMPVSEAWATSIKERGERS